MSNWPNDADGDVFRRLQEDGFDFSSEHIIDFNVDFAEWPPSDLALRELQQRYPGARVISPENESGGYVLVQLYAVITYQFVTQVQSNISGAMKRYNGYCNSWGILQE